MYDLITYMGMEIERKQLFSKKDIIAQLQEGPCFTALEKARSDYFRQYGNELYWNYPFCNGVHNGGVIFPVQEGFLWLPYDEVDAESYEQFKLEDSHLLTAEEAATLLKELKAYMDGICGALEDMQVELSAVQYQDDAGTIYYLEQGMSQTMYRPYRRFKPDMARWREELPGTEYTDRAQAQKALDDYASKHGLEPLPEPQDQGG